MTILSQWGKRIDELMRTAGIEIPAVGMTLFICMFTGLFGVFSGYAVFFLLLEKSERPWQFVAALGVAAVLSLIFETLRGVIDHGDHELRHHWSPSRVIVTLSMLAMAEFFVIAGHDTVGLHAELFVSIAGAITHDHEIRPDGLKWELGFLAGLWGFVGAVLAGVLSGGIKEPQGGLWEQVRVRARCGALTGIFFTPVALLLYVAAGLVIRSLYLLLFDQETWRENLRIIDDFFAVMRNSKDNWLTHLISSGIRLLRGLDDLWGGSWFGPPACYLIGVGATIFLARKKWTRSAVFVGASLGLVLVAPLLAGLGDLVQLVWRAGFIWAVPGLVLGAIVPLLDRPAARPGAWAGIAVIAALVLMLLTLLRFEERWWFLLPAGLLVVTGTVLIRSDGLFSQAVRMDEFWPQMALSVATLVCGLTLACQEAASFAGVYEKLHVINHLPSRLRPLPDFLSRQLPGRSYKLWIPSVDVSAFLNIDTQLRSAREIEQKLQELREERDMLELREQFTGLTQGESEFNTEHIQTEIEEAKSESLHHQMSEIAKLQDSALKVIGMSEVRIAEVEQFRPKVEKIKEVEKPALGAGGFLFPDLSSLQGARLEGFDGPKVDPQEAERRKRDALEAEKNKLGELDAANLRIREMRLELLELLDDRKREHVQARDNVRAFQAEVLDPWERQLCSQAARLLELSITASVGFWTTVGLLAGWSIFHHRQPAHEGAPS